MYYKIEIIGAIKNYVPISNIVLNTTILYLTRQSVLSFVDGNRERRKNTPPF